FLATVAWAIVDLARHREERAGLATTNAVGITGVGIVVALLSLLGFWAAWHGSTTELGRLGLVPAISLRIALIMVIASLITRTLQRVATRADSSAVSSR